jgi:hypothetical protein
LRNSDNECREIADIYYRKPNLIKRIAAKNSLEQFLDERDYLNIADMFVESDHAIAAFIAGREIERYLRNLCGKHGYPIREVGPDGRERNKSISKMLNDLGEYIGPKDRGKIREWYRQRSDLIHDRKPITTKEVDAGIIGWREFRDRRVR